MQDINAKNVAGYVFLPRAIPRAKRLFASGFGYIAFLMAHVYAMVRLLPIDHPYLNHASVNKFGIRHVIGEAANNLVISGKNIDQILVFSALLVSLVMVALQCALLVYFFIVEPAQAQMNISLFETENPQNDIALNLMDMVFGVPDFFCNTGGACSEANAASRTPFHMALHGMFQFYSLGLLAIGVLIFLYYIFVVTLETATTGTPFGQRFQNIWVPIRLVVALSLLVPINYGLNSGQYIALYAAKIGSGFATNGWLQFNDTMGSAGVTANNPAGNEDALLAVPSPPDFSPAVQFMSLVHACSYAQWHTYEAPSGSRPPTQTNTQVRPYFVKTPQPGFGDQNEYYAMAPNTDFKTALEFYNNTDIRIRFGSQDADENSNEKGDVKPICGEIRIPITSLKHMDGDIDAIGGAPMMQRFYYTLIRDMWFTGDPDTDSQGSIYLQLAHMSHRFMAVALGTKYRDDDTPLQCSFACGNSDLPTCGVIPTIEHGPCFAKQPDQQVKTKLVGEFQSLINQKTLESWGVYKDQTADFDIEQDVLDYGWGGAGIWYNKISEINGAFTDAVASIPNSASYPWVMEVVAKAKAGYSQEPNALNQYSPYTADGTLMQVAAFSNLTIAKGLSDFSNWWHTDGMNQDGSRVITSNIFMDIINTIFGTENLMAMQGRNAHIHPLAQLTALGKGMINSTVRNVMGSTLTAAFGGAAGALLNAGAVGSAIQAFGGLLNTTAFIGMTAGVVLYYVLPFLPFMYFFFAVAEWVKSIFEAMVGLPLWALAHLRIDGEGLPGPAAMDGYFLIFEIFLRPIMTVFGLIAATVIFTAQVRVLHFIWPLVIDNLTGVSTATDPTISLIKDVEIQRGTIDQFFFTVVYAIIVYMMANASFKLIDNIPDNMMRWMGSGASSFSDLGSTQESIQGMQRYVTLGGVTYAPQVTGAIRQSASSVGGGLTQLVNRAVGGGQGGGNG